MISQNKGPALSLLSLSLIALAVAQGVQVQNASAQTQSTPNPYSEGTETRIAPSDVVDLIPWIQQTETGLKDILTRINTLAPRDAKQYLHTQIQQIVLGSGKKSNETLTRYVLNRALAVYDTIQKEAIENEAYKNAPGVIDAQLRVLKNSAQLALKYHESDLAFLNGIATHTVGDINALPFADFGVDYARILIDLNNSILDASANFAIGKLILGFLANDLNRDASRIAFASVITRLDRYLGQVATFDAYSSTVILAKMREIKFEYQTALERIQEAKESKRRSK